MWIERIFIFKGMNTCKLWKKGAFATIAFYIQSRDKNNLGVNSTSDSPFCLVARQWMGDGQISFKSKSNVVVVED